MKSKSNEKLVDDVIKFYKKLKSSRINWDSHWDHIARYFIPKKDNIYGHQLPGEEKNNHLYDSTSIHSNELLASALHSMLTNPALKWFFLTTGEPVLDSDDEVRLWINLAVDKMHQVMNNSNFQTEVHEYYLDQGSFGTSPFYIEEDDVDLVTFKSFPIYECYIDQNFKGAIDTVYRPIKYTYRQLIQKYENLPQEYYDFAREKPLEECEVLHAVFPRAEFNQEFPKESPVNMPYASLHIALKTKYLLKENGYPEFPYAVGRWSKTSSEVYGRSPAMKSLPDTRMLNVIMKTIIRAGQKVVDPPLAVTDDGSYRPIRMTPGGTNYVRPGATITPIMTGGNLPVGFELAQEVRNRILQNFFIDQLQLNEGPQMTATEVRQRTEEKLRLLGPILGRQQSEFLKPLIDRVFGILMRKNELPPISESLQKKIGGKNLRVVYSSTIARVQKTSEAQNLLSALSALGPVLEANPNVMDNIDGDKAFKYFADMFSVPQTIMNNADKVEETRSQRMEAMAQQQQQEDATAEAEQLNKLAPMMGQ